MSTAGKKSKLSTAAGGSSDDPIDMHIKKEDTETEVSSEDSGEEEEDDVKEDEPSYEVDHAKSRK